MKPLPQSLVAHPVARIEGDVSVAGDKSISHRALLLGAVARGATRIRGGNAGEDVAATARAVAALGAPVVRSGDEWIVEGRGGWLEEPANVLDLGNSGTAMRLLAGLLSPQPFLSILTGDESLRSRPMERVAKPLREMGAVIFTRRGGGAPLVIAGSRLRPVAYELPVPSAQVKSALLLAALFTPGRSEVREPQPSRDHTERMLAWFGVEVDAGPRRASLEGPRIPDAADVHVPGDPSAAAFFVVAGALAREGSVTIRRVGVNPTRTGFLEVLRRMGASLEVRAIDEDGPEPVADLIVHPAALRGTVIGPEEIPSLVDEIPILTIAAASAEGVTEIRGARELRVKESDRLAAMSAGLAALGVRVEEREDGMKIHGRGAGSLEGGEIDSRADHRVAMSFLIAGLSARAPVRVRGTRWIATSDPVFLENLARLAPGAIVSGAEPGDGSGTGDAPGGGDGSGMGDAPGGGAPAVAGEAA